MLEVTNRQTSRERDRWVRVIAEEQSEKAVSDVVLETSTETEMPSSSWLYASDAAPVGADIRRATAGNL